MLRFIIGLVSCALLLLTVVKVGYAFHWIGKDPSYTYEILLFLSLATGIIFSKLNSVHNPRSFTQLYLLTLVIKIVASIIFNLVMISKDLPGAAGNVAFFMISYLIFTALETGFLYRKISRGQKDQ